MPRKDRDKRRVGAPAQLRPVGRVGLGYIQIKCQGCNIKFDIVNSDETQVACPSCKRRHMRPGGGWMRSGQGAREAGAFVLTRAPALFDAYGQEADELLISLFFDKPEDNFDAGYACYTAAGRLCHGDGEQIDTLWPHEVYDRRTKSGPVPSLKSVNGEQLVRHGTACRQFTLGTTEYKQGDAVVCPGEDQELWPHCQFCKSYARLKFAMAPATGLFNFEYYVLNTGSNRNYDSITDILREMYRANGSVAFTPFWLRIQEEPSPFRKDNQWVRTNHYFVYLQPHEDVGAVVFFKDAIDRLPAHIAQKALPVLAGMEPAESPKQIEGARDKLPIQEAEFEDIDDDAPPDPSLDRDPEPEQKEEKKAPPKAPAPQPEEGPQEEQLQEQETPVVSLEDRTLPLQEVEAFEWGELARALVTAGLYADPGQCFNKLHEIATAKGLKIFRELTKMEAWMGLGGVIGPKSKAVKKEAVVEEQGEPTSQEADLATWLEDKPKWPEFLEAVLSTFGQLEDEDAVRAVLQERLGDSWSRCHPTKRWASLVTHMEKMDEEQDAGDGGVAVQAEELA